MTLTAAREAVVDGRAVRYHDTSPRVPEKATFLLVHGMGGHS